MKMLEEGNEATIASINDLSEDTRKELDDIYLTLCNYLINQSKQLKIKSISLSGLSIIHMNNVGIKTRGCNLNCVSKANKKKY